MINRRPSRTINLGALQIGGGAPVSVQSMTNTETGDVSATSRQIRELEETGVDIVRVAVPDGKSLDTLSEIISNSRVPIIADIHFDYRLALGAIKAGVHGLRINPGNIRDEKQVNELADAAGNAGVPIRVGANAGSLPPDRLKYHLEKCGSGEEAQVNALVESALHQCEIFESRGFHAIKVSLKASNVRVSIDAYRKFAALNDYPLHLGITEAGTMRRGTIKSAVGIGTLLSEGIGDTIRVSLTADPVEEVKTGLMILESIGLRTAYPEIISCPTCSRTRIDLIKLVEKVELLVDEIKAKGQTVGMKKIAVMGCEVNGPGEAADADIGISGAKNKIILFKKGRKIGSYTEAEGFKIFRQEILSSCQSSPGGFHGI